MERLRKLLSRQTPGPQPAAAALAVEIPEESAAQTCDTNVQVIYGASVQTLPLAGQTISAARPLLEMILRADRRSPILVNGQQAASNYVITNADVIEIVHQAGEKGSANEPPY